jgi:hypothetical protein
LLKLKQKCREVDSVRYGVTTIVAIMPRSSWDSLGLSSVLATSRAGGKRCERRSFFAGAIELGASRVIVLPTGIACGLDAPPRGMVAVALHALTLLIARQLASDVERLRDRA